MDERVAQTRKALLEIYLDEWRRRARTMIGIPEQLGLCQAEREAFRIESDRFEAAIAKAIDTVPDATEAAYLENPAVLLQAAVGLHIWDTLSQSHVKETEILSGLKHDFDSVSSFIPSWCKVMSAVAQGHPRAIEIAARDRVQAPARSKEGI